MISSKHDAVVKLWDKTLGLLRTESNTPLTFKTRFGIHTFGMKNSIDILILDRTNNVVRIKENLSPQRVFIWNPKFDIVVEMPSGLIKKSKTALGDILVFK